MFFILGFEENLIFEKNYELKFERHYLTASANVTNVGLNTIDLLAVWTTYLVKGNFTPFYHKGVDRGKVDHKKSFGFG